MFIPCPSASVGLALDIVAPIINIATWTPGTQTLDITFTEGSGTVRAYVVSVLAASGDPSKAQIIAGSGAGIVEQYDSASQVASLSNVDLGFTSASDGANADEIHIVLVDTAGNQSDIEIIPSVLFDATAPTLSGVSTTPGDTEADLDWSTNEGAGDAYWVLTTSATVPSAAQIEAGDDHTDTTATDSGTAAISGTGAQTTINSTGLTNTTTYYYHLFHRDDQGNVSTISTTSVTPAASYTQNFVDTQGTGWLLAGAGDTFPARVEFSVWATINTLATSARFWEAPGGRALVWCDDGQLVVRFEDSSGTTVYDAVSTATDLLEVATLYHLYIGIDLGTPEIDIRLNGSAVTMTETTSITAGNGSLDFDDTSQGIFAAVTGTGVLDADVSDFVVLTHTSLLGYDAFYDGGSPPDPTTLSGTKHILLGADMTADERSGNTAQGWNDSYQIGSLGITGGSATFVDV